MIETGRLILRDWVDGDRAPFHAMNSDPRVMATIGRLMDRAAADASIDEMIAGNRAGLGLWAVERRLDGKFLGFCGIGNAPPATPVEGELEIGWRLIYEMWGHGFAREAAQASLEWAWTTLPHDSVAAITAATNTRSWGLMKRLGMTRDPDGDFDHPAVPVGDPLRAHITYRIARPISRPATP